MWPDLRDIKYLQACISVEGVCMSRGNEDGLFRALNSRVEFVMEADEFTSKGCKLAYIGFKHQ